MSRFCRLRTVHLTAIYSVTDRSIAAFAKNCLDLRHLDIRGCWRVTDASVNLVAEYCKSLQGLQVENCRDVSYQCIDKIASKGIKVDKLLRNPNRPSVQRPFLSSLNV